MTENERDDHEKRVKEYVETFKHTIEQDSGAFFEGLGILMDGMLAANRSLKILMEDYIERQRNDKRR